MTDFQLTCKICAHNYQAPITCYTFEFFHHIISHSPATFKLVSNDIQSRLWVVPATLYLNVSNNTGMVPPLVTPRQFHYKTWYISNRQED